MWTAEQTLSLRRPLLILLGRLHTNKHARAKRRMHILPRNVSEDFPAPSFPGEDVRDNSTEMSTYTQNRTHAHTHTHTVKINKQRVWKKTRPCSRKFTGFFFFWFWLKNFPWHGLRGRGVKKYVAHSEREIKWDSEAYRGAKLRRWKEIKAPGSWSGAGWGNTFPYVVSDRFLKGLAKNTCWWETNNVLKWDESELRTKPIPHYELQHTAQPERSVLQGENLLIKPLCLRRHCYTATWLHLHEYIWKHLQKSQHLVFQRLGSSWMFRWGEAGRLSNMPHWFRKSFFFLLRFNQRTDKSSACLLNDYIDESGSWSVTADWRVCRVQNTHVSLAISQVLT